MINALFQCEIKPTELSSCHEGFMKWNEGWKNFTLNCDNKVQFKLFMTYESWYNSTKGQIIEFKNVW